MIGTRRSRPKAFGCSFSPGGACRRLYSARSTSRATRYASSSVADAGGGDLRGRAVVLDVGLEHGIELVVGRQRLVVALVVAQLGGRRPSMIERGISSRPARSLSQRASAKTRVFGTSRIGAKPPAVSPYSVE